MRLRWLALGAGLALVLAVLTRGVPPPVALPEEPAPAAEDGETSPQRMATPGPMPTPPARDLFRYADPSVRLRPVTPAVTARRTTAIEAPEPPTEPTPPPVRLVGLVRRAEGLRAAVATASGVSVVGPGDRVDGFTVVSLDEDRGLRLHAADGSEIVLPPGE